MKERWLSVTNSCGQFLVHSRKIVHAVFQKLYAWHHSNWKNNEKYGKKEKTDLTMKLLLIVQTLELTILVYLRELLLMWGQGVLPFTLPSQPPTLFSWLPLFRPFWLQNIKHCGIISDYFSQFPLLELPPLPILLLPLMPPTLLDSRTPVPSPNLFRITYLKILPLFIAVFKLLA